MIQDLPLFRKEHVLYDDRYATTEEEGIISKGPSLNARGGDYDH